jgi:hypothetical protein
MRHMPPARTTDVVQSVGLENRNVTLSTILKVFTALKAKIKMQVELQGNSVQIA